MLPMNKTITPEELLSYAYGDLTDKSQEKSVGELIRSDNILYEEYLRLLETKQMIDENIVSPSDLVISRIISFSKSLADIDISEPGLRLLNQN